MQLKAISILCVLLAAQVFAMRDVSGISQRALKQGGATLVIGSSASSDSADGRASAAASGNIIIVGRGVVTAFVQATAIAETEVREAFVGIVARAISAVEDGGDAISIANVQADAFARAVARALTSTVVELESDAEGASACARAAADAETSAEAFARIFVDVLAEASSDINFASASATVDVLIGATASAYTNAQSDACAGGVFTANTYIDVFAEAAAIPFARVLALAFALATPNAAIADIFVRAAADVLIVNTVTGETASDVIGNARAVSDGGAGANVSPGP